MPSRTAVLELRSVRGTGGGPEKTILLGTQQADLARFDVTICYIRDQRDDVFRIDARAARLHVDYVEVRERHSFDHGIWRQLAALVRERAIDIVHAHDYKTNLIALLLARRCGIVALATAHGWTGQTPRERFAYYPADKWLLARFPRVIAVSSEIKQQLVRRGADAERVTVILNAIDPDQFRHRAERRPVVRAALGCAEREIVIGAVGRLETQKRFEHLLDAVARLTDRWPTLRLVVAGDGSRRSDLSARAARLGIAGRCTWLGHHGDVGDLHHAFDLFVQSSEYEGTPNAVLEAMAMQTPVIATDVGGTHELIADRVHGRLVPPNDVDALAEVIAEVLADRSAAKQRTAAARHRVETELSFRARTRAVEGIYEDLMRARGDRSAPQPELSGTSHA
jgi:glycosyltransferase involved in cell wall biosynthesis